MPESETFSILYTPEYNIGLLGIQKLHPFDTEKYGRAYKYLTKTAGVEKSSFRRVEPVDDQTLLEVHTPDYIESLNSSKAIAAVAELPALGVLPAFLLKKNLLKPMRYAVSGTILGAQLALQSQFAFNLSGGYHHAKAGNGEGFCYFADIPLAVTKLWKTHPDLKVLVIDLDAHQGNGIEAILGPDPRCTIMDVYNESIYPNDVEAKNYIDIHYPVSAYIEDNSYLNIVQKALDEAVKKSKPDLIIYNAGTDIFEEDKLGFMKVSEAGIILRDQYVFERANAEGIPILMVPSGGYSSKSGLIIGRSIHNLLGMID
jgi:histone deacetylase 11